MGSPRASILSSQECHHTIRGPPKEDILLIEEYEARGDAIQQPKIQVLQKNAALNERFSSLLTLTIAPGSSRSRA